MVDLYYRDPSDSRYKADIMETDIELEMLLNQIRMILFTDKADVLGCPRLGFDLETIIWETNLNKLSIQNIINEQFRRYLDYDSNKYDVEVDVEFLKGTTSDIGVLNIKINGQRVEKILIK